MSTTFSRSVDEEIGGAPRRSPCLFLVLEGLRPLAAPARFSLDDVDEVLLGRGDERAVKRGKRRLEVRVPDPWMSSRHARLEPRSSRWVLEDTSKNGTVVNGERVSGTTVLGDGDLIETQRTFFLFRDAVEGLEGAADVDARSAAPPLPALATVLPPLQRAFAEVDLLARSPVSIILFGESGTGKEVVARAVHVLSKRSGPFVAVNCGALVPSLVESELFGVKKGAFSGAGEDRPGLVRSAHKGTLFLDEVGDLPPPAQAALLRVLQEREVLPVGGTKPVAVDVRFVCASHRNLAALVETGGFRADLHARLLGRRVELPPLRDRTEDLGILVGAILARIHREGDVPALHPAAARALLLHDWPANVRELEQALTAACVLAGRGPIELKHLPPELAAPRPRPAAEAESEAQQALRAELARLLAEHKGNISAIARAMGKRRQQIQRWMRRLGMPPGRGAGG